MLEILAKIISKIYFICLHKGTLVGLTGTEVLPVLALATALSKSAVTSFPPTLEVFWLTFSVEFLEFPEITEFSDLSEFFEEVEVDIGTIILPIASGTASATFGTFGTPLTSTTAFSGKIFVEISKFSEISEISEFLEICEEMEVEVEEEEPPIVAVATFAPSKVI